jgi:hypothetical protein
VLSTVTAATELTIQWNGIEGVADVSSAGQTIPMLIGVGLVTRVLYIGLFGDIYEGGTNIRHPNMPTPWTRFPVDFGSPPSSDPDESSGANRRVSAVYGNAS